ncbi:MAG: helix-turn-helix domain-containing protein [Pseudomonadota bacterium]
MAFEPTPRTPNLSQRLTERELARHWRVSPRTLQRWRDAGTGPPWFKIGGRVLYAHDDILAFEQGRRTAGATP